MTRLLILVVLLTTTSVIAKETLVNNVAEFDAAVKAAKPGDEIVLAEGEWHDADLVFRGEGESGEKPIRIRAQTPGKVVLTGTSRLRIGGKHLFVHELLWKDSAAPSEVISFRIDSKHLAEHCTLRECAILGDEPDKERKWVSIYGARNCVQDCRFEAKRSGGTLLVVWLAEGVSGGRHRIDGNFFGPRQRLGKNGGEIIRIGDSKTSMQIALCKVTNNYFYRCDGEAEIISNKSCRNVYADNSFVGCSGALTLRHGNECEVSTNHFVGDGRKGTGGVRVIGEDHQIIGNVFFELTGDDTRAALSLMNGIPESPLNGYFQVKNPFVDANRFYECKQSIVVGLRDEDQKSQLLPPIDCRFEANIVTATKGSVFVVHTSPKILDSERNLYAAKELGIDAADGWTRMDQPSRLDLRERPMPVEPNDVGPAWMQPGDEYLPTVLKTK